MIIRIIFAFVLFAGLAYYYNVDVRSVVDKSGVPTWLASKGISTSATTTATSSKP